MLYFLPLTSVTLSLGFGFGLGPGRLVSAHPTPFAPDGSEFVTPLYIDDPTYFHEVVDTYPSLLGSARNTFITAPSSIPPSASISSHHSPPELPHAAEPSPHGGCQHFRDSLDIAQSWFRWAYQTWLNQVTRLAQT